MLQLFLHDAPGIQVRRQQPAHGFQIQQRLAQQTQLRRGAQAAGGGNAHQVQHHAAFGEAAVGGIARDDLPGLAQIAFFVEELQPRADADDFIGDFLTAPIHRGEQQFEQALAQARRHVRDHAQVEDRQATGRGDAQIAGMRIGMDLAMHEDLVDIAADQRGSERSHRLLGTAHIGDHVHAHALRQLHGQHAVAAVVPDRLWHPQRLERLEMLAEALQVLGLGLVVQLLHEGLGEFIEPVAQAHAASDLGEMVGGQRKAAQHVQIRAQLGGDLRLLHLDRHLAAIVKLGAVHLGDRGAAQWHRVEAGKQLGHRRAQFLFDDRRDALDRDRRNVLLHALQGRGELHRHHVRAGGEHLAQLDEGRPQRFQVGDELFRVAFRWHIVDRACVQVHAGKHAGITVAQQQAQDLAAAVHALDQRRRTGKDGRGVQAGLRGDDHRQCGRAAVVDW